MFVALWHLSLIGFVAVPVSTVPLLTYLHIYRYRTSQILSKKRFFHFKGNGCSLLLCLHLLLHGTFSRSLARGLKLLQIKYWSSVQSSLHTPDPAGQEQQQQQAQAGESKKRSGSPLRYLRVYLFSQQQGFGVGAGLFGGCSGSFFFNRSRLRLLVKEDILLEFF